MTGPAVRMGSPAWWIGSPNGESASVRCRKSSIGISRPTCTEQLPPVIVHQEPPTPDHSVADHTGGTRRWRDRSGSRPLDRSLAAAPLRVAAACLILQRRLGEPDARVATLALRAPELAHQVR